MAIVTRRTQAVVEQRTTVGAVLPDWERGPRVVVQIWRGEDIGQLTDGLWRRGSSSERCALHGGQTRPQTFQVRD
jgi:hypothetical protein